MSGSRREKRPTAAPDPHREIDEAKRSVFSGVGTSRPMRHDSRRASLAIEGRRRNKTSPSASIVLPTRSVAAGSRAAGRNQRRAARSGGFNYWPVIRFQVLTASRGSSRAEALHRPLRPG